MLPCVAERLDCLARMARANLLSSIPCWGFITPHSGSARIFGHDIRTDNGKIRGLVGYMPENDAFISKMSAVSLVQMMGELSGLPSGVALERAHEALFYVGLAEARYRKLGTYSLGMKQLAKLAQAIVHGPKLLILDEPTNGLDPSARQRMIRMIRDMRDIRASAYSAVLAFAARRGRHLRGSFDPEAGTHCALLRPQRRAQGEPALPRIGVLRGERRFQHRDRKARAASARSGRTA